MSSPPRRSPRFTDGIYGSVGGSSSKNQHGAMTAEINKSQSQVDGDWGARLRAGGGQYNYGQADASYRSSYGQMSGSVIQNRTSNGLRRHRRTLRPAFRSKRLF
jgi:hypothetical protein